MSPHASASLLLPPPSALDAPSTALLPPTTNSGDLISDGSAGVSLDSTTVEFVGHRSVTLTLEKWAKFLAEGAIGRLDSGIERRTTAVEVTVVVVAVAVVVDVAVAVAAIVVVAAAVKEEGDRGRVGDRWEKSGATRPSRLPA
ncbi:hypothetical protein AKJ16_DCAP24271 [Drosera capensis]